MRKLWTIALTGSALLCLAGAASAQGTNMGTTNLVNDSGKEVGTASFRAAAEDGVLISVDVNGMTPGWHGVHIHGVGDCSDHADHFKKSGGHLAEGDEQHGYFTAGGPHEGDLPNMWIAADGTGKADFFSEELEMEDLMDKDGSALMIHAGPDDYAGQPAGNSGERVACGVIAR